MRRILRKIGSLLCVLAVFFTVFTAVPADIGAVDENVHLTFVCERNGEAIPNIQWKLYRIGTYDGKKITLTGDFADYKVTFGDYSGKALADAASTLENYVIVKKPAVTAEGSSDSGGRLDFNNLESGTYLAVAKKIKEGVKSTIPAPTIFNVDISNGPALKVYPKFKILMTLGDEVRRFEVRKVWENPYGLPLKKTEITLGVYEDGELTETVKLNEENNWQYHWMVYEDADWRVIELDLPDDCTVIYRSDGTDYVVVNTYEPDIPEEGKTTVPTTATTTATTQNGDEDSRTSGKGTGDELDHRVTTTSGDKSTTVTTVKSSNVNKNDGDKIPQTGQLWWPVPVLVILGLVLIAVGTKITITGKKNND